MQLIQIFFISVTIYCVSAVSLGTSNLGTLGTTNLGTSGTSSLLTSSSSAKDVPGFLINLNNQIALLTAANSVAMNNINANNVILNNIKTQNDAVIAQNIKNADIVAANNAKLNSYLKVFSALYTPFNAAVQAEPLLTAVNAAMKTASNLVNTDLLKIA